MLKRQFFINVSILLIFSIFVISCRKVYVPKPYGYFRIEIPDTAYQNLKDIDRFRHFPYTFTVSTNAVIIEDKDKMEKFWINIHYPSFDADIHCSYKPITNNLKNLTDDAINFVYKHVSQASAIPEKEFANDEFGVYGVYFTLLGNTASPYQFFLTDSTTHFFRAAAYCNCTPNQDSLEPIHQYLQKDIIRLVESFEWQSNSCK